MNNALTKKQNIIYISIIVMILIYGTIPALTWIIIILTMGNIRRISSKNLTLYWIRMSGYFLIYLIPIFIDQYKMNLYIDFERGKLAILGSIILGIIIFFADYQKGKVMYSAIGMATLSYLPRYKIIFMIYNSIGAAICEEVYFRGYLLMDHTFIWGKLIISPLIFVLAHYSLSWSEYFSKKDFVRQFIIGFINSALFFYGESILPCIILHLACNGNWILIEIKRYWRFYIEPEKYDSLLKNDSKIEIDF